MHDNKYKLEILWRCAGTLDRHGQAIVGPTIVLHKNLECPKINGNGYSMWFKQMHISRRRIRYGKGEHVMLQVKI